VDIPYTNAVVPGYEAFVTQSQPLANTANTNGIYRQVIDASQLPEGVNYVSVAAFRKRNSGEAPLYREIRTAIYIDRVCPQVTFAAPGAVTNTTQLFTFTATDRTPNRVQVYLNPANLATLVSQAQANPTQNTASRYDRLVFQRTVSGLIHGNNTLGVVVSEESGRSCLQTFNVFVDLCPADLDDGSGNGVKDGGVDINDLLYYLAKFEQGAPQADLDNDGDPAAGVPDGGVDINDLLFFLSRFESGC
jgi:hypothetical protein